jgi:hypothetical protein
VVFEAFAWHDLVRLGDPAGAAERLVSLASRVDGDLIPTFAAHAHALTAGDAPGLARVTATFEQMGALLYAAETAAEAAREFKREGRTGSALTAAAQARRVIEGCGGAQTPALASLDTSLPLTARGHEIAGLAARGLSTARSRRGWSCPYGPSTTICTTPTPSWASLYAASSLPSCSTGRTSETT